MQRLLVVGLGNPGPRYQYTRHNAGFWVVSRLATAHERPLRRPLFRNYRTARVVLPEGELCLAQPMTYMNRSGEVLPNLMKRYRVELDRVLVVCDTLDLPPGKLRLKRGGSDAGHRGIASVVSVLGKGTFPRLYVGIGRPPEKAMVPKYVLSEPDYEESRRYVNAVAEAARTCERLLSEPIDTVMNELHRRN